jgi:hypothetical protein
MMQPKSAPPDSRRRRRWPRTARASISRGGASRWSARSAGQLVAPAGELGEDLNGEDGVRAQASGYVAIVLLSYIGQTPPSWLTREIERRIASMVPGAPRCAGDEVWLDDPKAAELCRRTLGTVWDVVKSCDPTAPKV